MAKTKVKSLEEYLKEWWQLNKGSYDKAIEQSDIAYNEKAAAAQTEFKEEYLDAHKDYAADDTAAAVQGYANEQKIKQDTASLGLASSGYRESALEADKGKLKNLRLGLTTQKDERVTKAENDLKTEQNKLALEAAESRADITADYEKQASSYATAAHKADTAAAAKENAAEIKAVASSSKSGSKTGKSDEEKNEKIIYYYTGVYDRDGFMMYLGSDGTSRSFAAGVNPYTGDRNFHGSLQDGEWVINTNWYNMHLESDDDMKLSALRYGVFSNGYQPRGIVQNGKNLGSLTAYETVLAKDSFTGKKQTVWTTGTKKNKVYWMWVASENRYVQVQKGDDGWKRKK